MTEKRRCNFAVPMEFEKLTIGVIYDEHTIPVFIIDGHNR